MVVVSEYQTLFTAKSEFYLTKVFKAFLMSAKWYLDLEKRLHLKSPLQAQ